MQGKAFFSIHWQKWYLFNKNAERRQKWNMDFLYNMDTELLDTVEMDTLTLSMK